MEQMIANFITEFNKIGDGKWAVKDVPDILYYAKVYYGVHKPTSEINTDLSDEDVQKRAVAEGIYYSMVDDYWTECQRTEMRKLARKLCM
jgi:hypothetical protein